MIDDVAAVAHPVQPGLRGDDPRPGQHQVEALWLAPAKQRRRNLTTGRPERWISPFRPALR
ncbi:hypothetical protein, partial [Saccharopolyspora indica]|uniref:hypothetical protein n=1 Tax=Saccharopolyspora indica TaxID=1229659 RepID=UPI002FE5979A